MRMTYSPAAPFFLFLVQWTDCHLAGALGLLRILIYKAYVDGKTTMSINERKASLREFYGTKVALPNCNHSICMKCYRNWRLRSQSCPFCRDSLKRVNSGDLLIYTSYTEVIDMSSICMENLKRLIMYVEKLPLIVPNQKLVAYDPHFR